MGVLAVVLLAWTVVSTRTSQQYPTAILDGSLRSVAYAESAFPDSDADGLPDWEEELLGTSPHKKDSDGNGISDMEEHKNEKQHLAINAIPIADQFNIEVADNILNSDNDNLTSSLFSQAIVDYTSLGGNPSGEEFEDIIVDLSNQVEGYSFELKFDENNVRLAPDTFSGLETYTNEYARLMQRYEAVLNADMLALISTWDDRSEAENNTTIETVRDAFGALSNEIVDMDVPLALAPHHIALANIFHNSAIVLEDMAYVDSDPVKSMTASAAYTQYTRDRSLVIVNQTQILTELFKAYATE